VTPLSVSTSTTVLSNTDTDLPPGSANVLSRATTILAGPIELDVPTRKYKTPRIYEQTVALAGGSFRQIFIRDLGHDEPTLLLTNDRRTSAPKLITRYAQRMLIENALSDAVRFFHMDALSSAVGLKVDFDMTMLVIASGLYRLMAKRMRGYADAQARQIFRDLIETPPMSPSRTSKSWCASTAERTCRSSWPPDCSIRPSRSRGGGVVRYA